MNKELKKYIELSEDSALERFKQEYPHLDLDKVKAKCIKTIDGSYDCETTITISKQEVSYGDLWNTK